jgi:hypothetical protein
MGIVDPLTGWALGAEIYHDLAKLPEKSLEE